jgi:hypothetical protein
MGSQGRKEDGVNKHACGAENHPPWIAIFPKRMVYIVYNR